jgi:hypothetical protein
MHILKFNYSPKAVLYNTDMEPITILPMKPWMYDHIYENQYIKLAIFNPISLLPYNQNISEHRADCRTVDIWGERFIRKDIECMMLFTHDEETALLLKSDFLPGQQRAINNIRKESFAKGFFNAWSQFYEKE